MRLAFVDTEFAWPPPGGAQIDVFRTMEQLQVLGHDVHLFTTPDARLWRFGDIDGAKFHLPFTQIQLGIKPFDMERAAEVVGKAILDWKPDVVFLSFGFYLKPYLAAVLRDVPVVSRFYTYEMICIRDFFLFRDYETCPYGYLANPNECRRCFVTSWKVGIRSLGISEFAEEFLHVGGMKQAFYDFYVDHIKNLNAIIVSNQMTKERLDPYNDNVHVLTGGVRLEDFSYAPPTPKGPADKKIIFMAGRADDPMKGLDLLIKAGALLARDRDDFEIWVTSTDAAKRRPWLELLGWHEQAAIRRFYAESDICVVPSLWDEPFGLVAVEAMAIGRPVVVSQVGGLQHIPVHGETGFVFTRKDEHQLAGYLARLLDDYPLRLNMGKAGRQRVEDHFDWRGVIERFYPDFLQRLTS
jgi:glycosyltransferase involved in cell wall biosynthesis